MPVLQVGQYIVSKGGAVTAEQLAPYLDVQLDDLERVDGQVNESFVVRCYCLVAARPSCSLPAFLCDQLLEWGCSSSVHEPPCTQWTAAFAITVVHRVSTTMTRRGRSLDLCYPAF